MAIFSTRTLFQFNRTKSYSEKILLSFHLNSRCVFSSRNPSNFFSIESPPRDNLMKYKNEVRPEEAANLDKVLAATGLPVSAKFPMEAAELAKVLGWETG